MRLVAKHARVGYQIRAALGVRSFDRLREGARVLTCTWPSHRGR